MGSGAVWQYGIKVAITAIVVVAVAELAKRSSFWGALLASLPLTSLLAFVWLYLDTGDAARVASLSTGIFWLVLPSLPLFLVLPALLKAGWNFWPSLLVSCSVTAACYVAMAFGLGKIGIKV
jgi:hypothetical protein